MINNCIICNSNIYKSSYSCKSDCFHSFEIYDDGHMDLYYFYNNCKYIISFQDNLIEINIINDHKTLYSSKIEEGQFSKEFIEKIFDSLIFS